MDGGCEIHQRDILYVSSGSRRSLIIRDMSPCLSRLTEGRNPCAYALPVRQDIRDRSQTRGASSRMIVCSSRTMPMRQIPETGSPSETSDSAAADRASRAGHDAADMLISAQVCKVLVTHRVCRGGVCLCLMVTASLREGAPAKQYGASAGFDVRAWACRGRPAA